MKELLARADHHEREAAHAFIQAAEPTSEEIDAERLAGLDNPFPEVKSALKRNLGGGFDAALEAARAAGRASLDQGE